MLLLKVMFFKSVYAYKATVVLHEFLLTPWVQAGG